MSTDQSGQGDVDRTLQLLWEPEEEGRRRALTVEAIVDRAISIADQRGMEAVSIRSVASALDVGAMSLYRYVPSKAELIDLMLDRAQRLEAGDLPAGWRPAMEEMGRELWRLHTTHRWLPFVDQSRPVLGPNAVHRLDRAMAALAETGLTDQEKVSVVVTIDSFVVSLAKTENSITSVAERTGVSHEAFWKMQEAVLGDAMASGRFPAMAALSDDSFDGSLTDTLDFGLTAILDGVASLLATRGMDGSDA